jgi:cellulose synthase/poly-beta-1,6-N-acetylglucosamine synthase-like glycosyltransferase
MKLVFWAALSFLAYTYLGYPLWLYLRSRSRALPVRSAAISAQVSVVMAVHNEEKVLARKLRNLEDLDYPSNRYEIVVVSDGSTDGTNEILRNHANPRLRVLISPQHEGKALALNRGVQAARGEIVVFTDARQVIAPDAVRHLVADLADPSVGCVSGDIALGHPNTAAPVNGLGLYWKLETNVRRWEGATGSLIAAAGCLYAVRKHLAVPLPAGIILDDVYLPLHVSRQGAKAVYEPRSRGWDYVQSDRRVEFRRKVRTLLGNYQLLKLAPWLLTRANPVRFEFVCHKVLRLLAPFALLALLVSSLSLQGAAYQFAAVLQLLCLALAALGMFRPRLGFVSRVADVSFAFLVLNTAAVVALIYFVIGKKQVWVR